MRLVQDGWQIQIDVIATFLMIFGVHLYIYLIHSQSEYSCA